MMHNLFRISSPMIACLTWAFLLSLFSTGLLAEESKKVPDVKTSTSKATDKVKKENKSEKEKKEDELDDILAGHSFHGVEFDKGPRQAGRLVKGTGNVHFSATTKNPLVQKFINQGVGQLHGFWFFEAERSFRQAAALDADCAIAYWGMAMANMSNSKRAKGFIKKAYERKEKAGARERMWILSLHNFHNKKYKDDKAKWQAYVSAIENIVHKYPKDIEAKAFLALHLFWGKSGKAIGVPSREAVDAILSQVFAANPMHPAHHYRIHLWDTRKPDRALHAAAHVGQASPGIAHMWHMSGHIFSRLKRYDDASWQQEASSRVDHAYMVKDRVLPTEIHNYTHNQEWFIRNLIKVGRIKDAIRLAKNLVELPRHPRHNIPSSRSSAVVRGRTRLLDVLILFELWDELIQLAETPYLDVDDAKDARVRKLRYLGVAHATLKHQKESDALLKKLEALLAKEQIKIPSDTKKKVKKPKTVKKTAKKPVKDNTKANSKKVDSKKTKKKKSKAEINKIKKQIKSIQYAIAHIRGQQFILAGKNKEALVLLKKAGKVSKTALAKAYLKAGDKKEAEKLAKQAVVSAKNECYPLACYVQTLYECGKQKECRKTFEALRKCSSAIDVDMSVFAELEPIAIKLGYTKNWLQKPAKKNDVGKRPPLESLGPLLWHTSAAPQWSLPQVEGKSISLSDYKGKSVVVIFYLGFGCLHCVEQLNIFSPMAKQYRDAGIEMVAIGSEELPDIKKALEAFRTEKQLHIPLLSDAKLNIFKQYRCFDDFENQTLHGTFLIDSKGQIKWSDISYEPFTDAKFLLKESQRLLSLPPNKK